MFQRNALERHSGWSEQINIHNIPEHRRLADAELWQRFDSVCPTCSSVA
jgi:hypothetical protein